MKKLFVLFGALCALCLSSAAVSAANGDIIGNVYPTDIKAYVNGNLVPSCNIGGKTAIILEDLEHWNTGIDYNDKLRTLLVDTVWLNPDYAREDIPLVGEVNAKHIYESDIKTYLNGTQFDSAFSLNGRIAAAIEDFAADNEYSGKYFAKYVWNPQERAIYLEFLAQNREPNLFEPYGTNYTFEKSNEVTITPNTTPFASSSVNGTEHLGDGDVPSCGDLLYRMPNAIYYEVYGNVGTYAVYYSVHFYEDDDGTTTLETDNFRRTILQWDEDKLRAAAADIEVAPPTREEIVGYFTSDSYYSSSIERFDTDDCTFLYIVQSGLPHGGSAEQLMRITNDGKFYDYAYQFESVSQWGQKHFDKVEFDKENETVLIHYDKDYMIDLKTGEMTEK